MGNHAAITVYHQFSPSQSRICLHASADKTSGWIDKDFCIFIRWKKTKCRKKHLFSDLCFQFLQILILRMLTGYNHTIQTDRLSILILYRHLCFPIRADSFNIAASSTGRQFPDNPVCKHHRHGHKLRRLITGISDHDALIPGTLKPIHLIVRHPFPFFFGFPDCIGNVRTLLMDKRIHGNPFAGISHFRQYFLDYTKHIRFIGAGDLSISPATMTVPFVASTSQATLESASFFRHISKIASAIWSHTLSGCPSVTASAV